MRLTEGEKEMAAGGQGPACAFAMEILLRYAEAVGAEALIGVTQAHVDGCLYHGQVSLDFVERLVA
ncbi:MAG TPA: aconitase X, partial [Roseiarcus sp.]|nr:aconitase X [Roseiarcus sp.]